MNHPNRVWVDQAYANEPLERLGEHFVEYLRGRAKPAAAGTIARYAYSLQTFRRSLERQADPVTLGSLTPYAINRWVAEQRRAGLSEDGISSRLAAVKAFSRKYVYKELELTTCDLLEKVSRITPPEKPFPRLTDDELQRIMGCFDRGTYADIRDRAFVAALLATGRRFREILFLKLPDLDVVSGQIFVRAKGGDTQMAVLSPKALKLVKQYLRERSAHNPDGNC